MARDVPARGRGNDGNVGMTNAEKAKLAVIVVAVVLLAAFVIDNTKKVNVGFVVTDKQAPMFLVLLITAVLGALIGFFGGRASKDKD